MSGSSLGRRIEGRDVIEQAGGVWPAMEGLDGEVPEKVPGAGVAGGLGPKGLEGGGVFVGVHVGRERKRGCGV